MRPVWPPLRGRLCLDCLANLAPRTCKVCPAFRPAMPAIPCLFSVYLTCLACLSWPGLPGQPASHALRCLHKRSGLPISLVHKPRTPMSVGISHSKLSSASPTQDTHCMNLDDECTRDVYIGIPIGMILNALAGLRNHQRKPTQTLQAGWQDG